MVPPGFFLPANEYTYSLVLWGTPEKACLKPVAQIRIISGVPNFSLNSVKPAYV